MHRVSASWPGSWESLGRVALPSPWGWGVTALPVVFQFSPIPEGVLRNTGSPARQMMHPETPVTLRVPMSENPSLPHGLLHKASERVRAI